MFPIPMTTLRESKILHSPCTGDSHSESKRLQLRVDGRGAGSNMGHRIDPCED